ncbi:hypothetical protein [Xylella taiwanensis]|uniref:Uncharacterized protein n=1 Tax=Xylella taiwanensis TaxID=1444770 RepID=Z9JHE6_9GAMM|nr:hypothetical protein [Xylella taiwanensis]EWS77428.1 hypothetical protein AF72_10800 [Xylella taiwanensis]MCD8466057.1 hypothetical protein [Xylella taiwanensis]
MASLLKPFVARLRADCVCFFLSFPRDYVQLENVMLEIAIIFLRIVAAGVRGAA